MEIVTLSTKDLYKIKNACDILQDVFLSEKYTDVALEKTSLGLMYLDDIIGVLDELYRENIIEILEDMYDFLSKERICAQLEKERYSI